MTNNISDDASEPLSPAGNSIDALTALIVEGEEDRRAERAERDALDDTATLSTGHAVSLRSALRIGGSRTLLICFFLVMFEELDRTALAVLAPDIQRALKVSDTALVGLASIGGVAVVLGAIPLAWLADRARRTRILSISVASGSLMAAATGAVPNPFAMFWARTAVGGSHAYRLPVHSSLLSDTYPVEARAKVFAFEGMGRPLGLLVGPLLAGGVANAIGGPSAWRWAFVVAAIPGAIVFLWSLSMREPIRGGFEQQLVLGKTLEANNEMRISMSAAYERLNKIKTFKYLCVGIGVLGFALVAVPVQISFLLDRRYGYGPYTRGWMTALTWVASLVAIPIAGSMFDRIFQKDPRRLLRVAGICVMLYGVAMIIALRTSNIVVLLSLLSIANGFTSASFVAIGPTVAAVAPTRMRAQAFALVPVFIFLMGGFFGGLLAGSLSDSYGERTALTVIAPPAGLIGGLLVIYGSRFIRRDIAMAVAEIREEQEELARMATRTDDVDLLQVRHLDVSYGPVQILFDVNFEVRRGQVLALLGTNGAGKSTLLRAISGLTLPDRGVVRLDGRTITYADAELRAKEGIVQLRGGAGVFASLTVEENLNAAALALKLAPGEHRERRDAVYTTFPGLLERRAISAGQLSGGQQQMLAFGMCLMQRPKLLLIDELSLGLAPVIVQDLLAIVDRLKAQGITMVIVEQSLNVALALADQAVFLEKGHIRFHGPARELVERGDLVRAVFLGADGG